MHGDDEFLRSIPAFLRRHDDRRRNRAPAASRTLTRQAQIPEEPSPEAQASITRVIDLAARQAEAAGAGGSLTALSAAGGETACDDTRSGNAALRAPLPQGVAGRIGAPAAKSDKTRRAKLFRALRLAGLRASDGSGADRPGRAAKGRQRA